MKRFVLCVLVLVFFCACLSAQNVFDPSDPIIRYDKSQPVGSPENPDTTLPGLQKFVSTPTIGVSIGTDTLDNTSFKQYFINYKGTKMAFRIKFPYSYTKSDSASKKYPIMLFLHGGGEVGCSSNGGIFNNEKQIWLGGKLFRDRVNKNEFDGFLLYPQYVISDGCFAGWGTAPSADFTAIIAMVDSMVKYARADIDRLLVDGLSGGGYGAWRMAAAFPQRIAKIMPSAAAGSTTNRNIFVHIPIWFATGGLDTDPSPSQAQYTLSRMKEIGADIRYTVFPERGHSCWYQHWREPDFVPAMNDVHKANPLCFFQHNEFCNATDINSKLGLTPGFYAYEWSRDGVTIALHDNNTDNILDTSSVISFSGNEISVKAYGTYRARFKRTATSDWSDWSPKPVIVKTKGTTQTQPITIQGAHSKVLAAPDGSTTVPLTLPDGFLNYQWYRVSDGALVDSTQTYQAPVGQYKARYDEQFGCGNEFSPIFTVIDANGEPKPEPATNVQAAPVSKSVMKVDWNQTSGTTDQESGFELYRSTSSGGPYKFIKIVPANIISTKDSGLTANTLYHYIVRAVNSNGAAVVSNEAPGKTIGDNTAPTAPSNLRYVVRNSKDILLKWNASTDNDGIARYDIFVNGVKLYSTSLLQFVITDLDSTKFYNFTVKAVDSAANVSPASNQVTVNTKGLKSGNIPGVPADVSAIGISYNQIEIRWTDTVANETGFEIVRSATSSGTYLPVGTARANDSTFIDSGLAATKTYYYKVRAISAAGESAFSSKVSATTLAAPNTPVAPSKLTAVEAGSKVSLTWVDNSLDETSFQLFRSSDSVTFTLLATLPANSDAYTDLTASGSGAYYYYVAGVNDSGIGEHSNTAQVKVGAHPPVITGLTDILVTTGSSNQENFTVTDDPGEIINVTIPVKPQFIVLERTGSGTFQLKINPTVDDVGTHNITVEATDNFGKTSSVTIVVTVSDKNTRAVFINFGASGKPAPSPWNNWLGTRKAGDVLTGIKDESNVATNFSVTTLNAWTTVTTIGHITGDNSGVFPDAVLESGLADSGDVKQIKFSGLNTAMQYNIVFVGSQNEGLIASASYSTGNQSQVLDARYNTNRTGNLNNLVPDANGEIVVSISRTDGSLFTYLNGIQIEEYAPSVSMLNPANLFAEAANRSTIKLSWSDRTNNENTADGYELTRSTDSLFTKNVTVITLPANSNAYTNTELLPNTKYWFTVRTKGSTGFSEYSNRTKAITPATIVYVNFNTTVADAPYPWNSLTSPPLSNFTTDFLKNQSGVKTNITLTLSKEFNGEFTAGVNTGNNSGIVPDNVLMSNYWLDRGQLSQFTVSGLNHTKRYRFGFIGSASPPNWFKGNYTATYTINQRTVYLNSWQNSSKIVYIGDVSPNDAGTVVLNFSTTPAAGYGFNAGVIIQEYTDTASESISDPPAVDSIPPPPPIDSVPGGGNPPPVDSVPGGNNPPPIDSIPGGNNPPPVDSTGGGSNPPPVDSTGGGGNPPPIDSTGGGGIGNPPPIDSSIYSSVSARLYPNPVTNQFRLDFNNLQATNKITVEIYEATGIRVYRRDHGQLPSGKNSLLISAVEARMRSGLYILTLRINGKIVQTMKIVKMRT